MSLASGRKEGGSSLDQSILRRRVYGVDEPRMRLRLNEAMDLRDVRRTTWYISPVEHILRCMISCMYFYDVFIVGLGEEGGLCWVRQHILLFGTHIQPS